MTRAARKPRKLSEHALLLYDVLKTMANPFSRMVYFPDCVKLTLESERNGTVRRFKSSVRELIRHEYIEADGAGWKLLKR